MCIIDEHIFVPYELSFEGISHIVLSHRVRYETVTHDQHKCNPWRRNKCAVFICKEAVNDHSLRTTEPLIRCGWQQGIQNKIWSNRHWAALCCKPWFLSQLQVRNNASLKWHIWNYIYKKTQTGCISMETEFVHYIWTRIRISGNLRSHIWTAILTLNDWFICKNVSHNLELPKWLHPVFWYLDWSVCTGNHYRYLYQLLFV